MLRTHAGVFLKRKFIPLPFVLLFAASACHALELQPSFPNHALVPPPPAEPRQYTPRVSDLELPFAWDQAAVIRQGSSLIKQYRGFDPLFQPVQIEITPTIPVNLNVVEFDGVFGLQSVMALAKTAGLQESFQFRAIARGIPSDFSTYTYYIHGENDRLRTTPQVTRSPGDVIKPGQIVRYSWSSTSDSERFPKCEAEFSGRTGPAKGLLKSTITQVLAVKAQAFVLGHYLMLVTPRDIRGEPPRGSVGNGLVFRCAFGSANLPPATDGFSADNFLPAVNQPVTLRPNATDPETGQTVFNNQFYEFGDGSTASGVNGPAVHAYALPGIYRVRCTMSDDQGAAATAEDSIVVGAAGVARMACSIIKQIPPEEAGNGPVNEDSITAAFKDTKGIRHQTGDRIVFLYNRNQFGKANPSDNGDDTDILLNGALAFSGKTRLAKNITVGAAGASITIKVTNARLDRTGDPRLGRSELKGIFTSQRIAVALIPADGTTPRALVYTGNIQARVKGGQNIFFPEERVTATATTKLPNPKIQEP